MDTSYIPSNFEEDPDAAFRAEYGYGREDVVMHTAEKTFILEDGTEETRLTTEAGMVILLPFDEEAEQFASKEIPNPVVVMQVNGWLLVSTPENFKLNPDAARVAVALDKILDRVEYAKDSLERDKARFIERFNDDPVYALGWGEDVAKESERYNILRRWELIARYHESHPEEYTLDALRESLAMWVERHITDPLLQDWMRDSSTSPFHNACESAKRAATSAVYTRDVPAIRGIIEMVAEMDLFTVPKPAPKPAPKRRKSKK